MKHYAVFTNITNELDNYMAVLFKYGGPDTTKLIKDNRGPKIDQTANLEVGALYLTINKWIKLYDSKTKKNMSMRITRRICSTFSYIIARLIRRQKYSPLKAGLNHSQANKV